MSKNKKITWTETAIQLTGEVPASCVLENDGRMRVKKADGQVLYFEKKEVSQAQKDLEAIAKAANPKEAQPTAPAKPKTGSKR